MVFRLCCCCCFSLYLIFFQVHDQFPFYLCDNIFADGLILCTFFLYLVFSDLTMIGLDLFILYVCHFRFITLSSEANGFIHVRYLCHHHLSNGVFLSFSLFLFWAGLSIFIYVRPYNHKYFVLLKGVVTIIFSVCDLICTFSSDLYFTNTDFLLALEQPSS